MLLLLQRRTTSMTTLSSEQAAVAALGRRTGLPPTTGRGGRPPGRGHAFESGNEAACAAILCCCSPRKCIRRRIEHSAIAPLTEFTCGMGRGSIVCIARARQVTPGVRPAACMWKSLCHHRWWHFCAAETFQMSSKRFTGEVAHLGGVAIEFRNVCFTVKDRLSGNSLDILKNVSGKVGDPPAAHTVDQWRAKVSTSIVACARHSLARPPPYNHKADALKRTMHTYEGPGMPPVHMQ